MVSVAKTTRALAVTPIAAGWLALAIGGSCLPDLSEALPDDDTTGDDDTGDDDVTGDDDDETGDDDDETGDDDTGDDDTTADIVPRIELHVTSDVLDPLYRYDDGVVCTSEPGLWTFQATDEAAPGDLFQMSVDAEPVLGEDHADTLHAQWLVGSWEVDLEPAEGICELTFSTVEPHVSGRIECNDQRAVDGELEEVVHIHLSGFICP